MPVLAIYCVLFVLGAGGNLSVVITLFRSKRHRRSRVSLMMFNLAMADGIVCFFMIPLEVKLIFFVMKRFWRLLNNLAGILQIDRNLFIFQDSFEIRYFEGHLLV